MSKKISFSGQLYQLFSKSQLSQGAYVAINGPHDTFGRVLKSEKHTNGSFLNLIRGVKKESEARVVCNF